MIHWGGLKCCFGAVALYLLSRRTGRAVEFLKSATRVYQLKDLAKLLQVESKVYPLIIAVSGRVGSETPLKCEDSGILGVLIEETVEQQFLKRNWKFSWVKDCALMKPTSKEVPWYLDDGTGRVNVVGAKDAISFPLTFGSSVFEKSEPSSFLRAMLDYLKGFKMLGVRRIERVLPIDTPLTIVGEAIKDSTGDVRIQKPEQWPFYVSPIPLDEHISKLGKWSRRFKYASIGLTILGVIMISKPVIEDILERRRLWLLRKRAGEAAVRRMELAIREAERQHENSSGGTSRYNSASTRAVPVTRRTEPVTRSAEPVEAASRRADPVTRGLERQHENNSNGTSRDRSDIRRRAVDAATARRAELVTRGLERQLENSSNGTSRDNSASRRAARRASRRAEPVTEGLSAGLERQDENRSNVTSRDRDEPDHCVICLSEKYNAAFVPCGHMCCCIACSWQTMMRRKTCPLCRTPIDDVLKIYRH